MRRHFSTILWLFIILTANVNALYYKDVTAKDFDKLIDSSQAHIMIEFYAPWCGHCKALAPEYEQLGNTFESSKDVIIAQVDADKHKKLAKRFKISGFPTLKWLPKGADFDKLEDVTAGRTAADLLNFINQKTGLSKKLAGAGESQVIDLTSASFKKIALKESNHALVGFFAPWCGHCKALKPTWEKLAKLYADEENVVIGAVNCDDETDLSQTYKIQGFPTIKYFGASAEPEAYDGGRSLGDFVKFLNEKTGLEVGPDGGLAKGAGTISEIKQHIRTFLSAETDEERGSVIDTCEETIKTLDEKTRDNFLYYAKVFKKIAEKGQEYIATEKARLSKMLESGDSLKSTQKRSFIRRINVLNEFSEL